MIKKQILTLIALCSLCFMSCNDSNTKSSLASEDEILLEVELERNMTSKHPLDIIFKLTNLSDKTVYYDNSSVPFGDGTSLSIFSITEDGVQLQYKGALIQRWGTSFSSLSSGETYQTQVSLDRVYEVTKGSHNYEISVSYGILAKTSDDKLELLDEPEYTGIPVEADQLALKDHTSKPINVASNLLEFDATLK